MKKRIKQIFCLTLCVLSVLGCLIIPVSAYDSEVIVTLVDDDSIAYSSSSKTDSKKKGNKYEYKYLNLAYLYRDATVQSRENLNPNAPFMLSSENASFFFKAEGYMQNGSVITDDSLTSGADKLVSSHDLLKTKQYKNGSPLSFPYYYTEQLAAGEEDYAVDINSKLSVSLNAILRTVNGKPFTSISELINKSIMIRPDDERNVVVVPTKGTSGYLVVYATLSSNPSTYIESYGSEAQAAVTSADDAIMTQAEINRLNADDIIKDNYKSMFMSIDNGLWCYVIPYTVNGDNSYRVKYSDAYIYEYAFPKGRQPIGTNGNYVKQMFDIGGTETTSVTDISWVSIHLMAFYANATYKYYGICASTNDTGENENAITKWINGLAHEALKQFREDMGMSEVDKLVYNSGSSANRYGVMNDSWWSAVLKYSVLFQTIAWGILVFGLMKMAVDLNFSAINPMRRLDLYQTIEKFVLAGMGLVILIPATQFLLECNDTIVEIFSTQVDTQNGLRMPSSGHWLLNIIIEFLWNGVVLYINFAYIMRSVTIAILIASGPFFISTGAISSNGRSPLFANWSKELIANIFLQAIHSFILAFLIELMSGGSALESFAIITSFVPLTEMFRSMIFGNAGGAVLEMAKQGAQTVGSAMGGIAKGAVAGAKSVGGAAAKMIDGDSSAKEDSSFDGGGGGGGRGQNGHSLASALQKKLIQRGAAKGGKSFGWSVAGAAGIGLADAALTGVGQMAGSLGTLTKMGVTGQTDHRLGDMIADNIADNGIGAQTARAATDVAQPAIEAHRANENSKSKIPQAPQQAAPSDSQSAGATAAKGLEETRRSANIQKIVRSNKTDSMLTQYKMKFGGENQPEGFEGNNSGGGDLVFADKKSCVNYMRGIGQEYAAQQIEHPETYGSFNPYGDGTVMAGKRDDGKFAINFNTDPRNGRGTMGNHGLDMSVSKDQKSVYLATKGNVADDVFAYHKTSTNHMPNTTQSTSDKSAAIREASAASGTNKDNPDNHPPTL